MVDIRKPLNVFAQSVVPGQIALMGATSPESLTVMIEQSSVATVYPAYPVKLVPGSSQIPLVDLADPDADDIYGIALYNPKVTAWVKKDILQVATKNAVLYFKSGGSLSRGARVGLDGTDFTLQAQDGTNVIGILLDDAGKDDIVRVELDLPLCSTAVSGDGPQ